MVTSRSLAAVTAALLLALVLGAGTVRAEVSAEIDRAGHYVRTVVQSGTSSYGIRIWTVLRSRPLFVPLNRDGDVTHDLWPTIRENPTDKMHPWVLWSRFDGYGYGIAYSHWSDEGGWTPIAWLEQDHGEQAREAFDPAVAFDAGGQPFATWWATDGGNGRVLLSMFLLTRWSSPYLISSPAEDARDPVIEILPDGKVQITYVTPAGLVTHVISFPRPATITDDINPFNGAVDQVSSIDEKR